MKKLLLASTLAIGTWVSSGVLPVGLGYAEAQTDNPWMIRGRVIAVTPDEGGDLSVGGARLAGDVAIED